MTPSDLPADPRRAARGANSTAGTGGSSTDSASNPVPLTGTVASAGPPKSLTADLDGTPRPGALLGQFRLVRELGRGGMGVVYEATDEMLRRRVALKVMNAQTAADATFRARFLREGQAVAALKSDHVVNVYAAGEHGGVLYLAMEFIDGPTLDGWLKTRTVTTADVLWVARDMLAGLASAHARNLIHRDIKPGNLMYDPATRRFKLLDFGLVRDLAPAAGGHAPTATQAIVGTPAYMSPEQARQQKLDPRSDLFSAGTVLYRLVIGQSPFSRESIIDVLHAVVHEPPPPLAGVPKPLSDFVARLMEPDPADRPNDAGAALDELRAVEAEMADASPTDTYIPDREPARPAKRKPLWIGLAAAVVLAVVAGVLLTRGKSDPNNAQNPPEPNPVPQSQSAPKPLSSAHVLALIRDDIQAKPGPMAEDQKPARLYLFAPHLASGSSLSAADRTAYRTALDALAAHLRPDGKLLRPLEPTRTVFAVEPAGEFRAPDGLFVSYPYGLSFDQPDDEFVRGYTGPVAYVRADWFVRYVVKRVQEDKEVFGVKTAPPAAVVGWAAAWGAGQVDLAMAADELGTNPEQMKRAVGEYENLREQFLLGPLAEGKTIPRSVWESRKFTVSGFHALAARLNLGIPVLTR